jgi:hypothetical protein
VEVGYIFLTLGICTVLGTVFIAVFLIETKGRTNREISDALSGTPQKKRE